MASLQNRISVRVVIAAGVFSTLAALFGYTMTYRDMIQAGQATLEGLVGSIENTTAIGAYASDTVLVSEVADGLITNKLVGTVEVKFADKTVLNIGEMSPVSADGFFGGHVIVRRNLQSPFGGDEPIGAIIVHADMQELGRQAGSQALLLAGLMALQVFLVAAVLGFAVNRIVGSPMARIAAQLSKLVPGKGMVIGMPPGHEKDEIGVLVSTTNRLLEASETALARESELLASKAALEAQYRKIFNTSSAGIFMLDGSGQLIDCNPTTLQIIDQPLEVVKYCSGPQLFELVFSDPRQTIKEIQKTMREKRSFSSDIEIRVGEERTRWVHFLLSEHQGETAADRIIEGVMYDVTERRQMEDKSRHMAMHDQLTGLLNRAALPGEMHNFIAKQECPEAARYTLLYIDLDGFKPVNDTHGHHAGDKLLIDCSARMRRSVRTSDLVFRLGGDEFMIVLLGTSIQEPGVTTVALKILEDIKKPYQVGNDVEVKISASIGLASVPEHGSKIDDAMKAADSAMYYIKKLGKSGLVVAYPAEGNTESHNRPDPAERCLQALENQARDGAPSVALPRHSARPADEQKSDQPT